MPSAFDFGVQAHPPTPESGGAALLKRVETAVHPLQASAVMGTPVPSARTPVVERDKATNGRRALHRCLTETGRASCITAAITRT
jgi:hypothetical protein